MKTMSLKPRMSEKAYEASQANNTYVFMVPIEANKASVISAVAAQFGVTVEDVRLAVVKGKPKKAYRKRTRPVEGSRSDAKKAYVRVKAGETINVFGEMEKAEEKAQKTEQQVQKAMTKQAEKQQKGGKLRQAFGRSPRQTQNRGGE